MTLVPASSLDQTISSSAPPVVHVRSIELKFKTARNKHPISIKARFGENGSTSDKSKRYGKTEDVHWLCERRLSLESHLTVIVREHHSLRRTIDIMTIPISVSDLVTKPFFEAGSDTSSVSLKIHSTPAGPFIDVIRRLVEQSQVRLEAMRIFLGKLGMICEALDYVVTITDAVSSVHPAAESAATVAISLLELCQEIQECHTSACELMEDVSTFLLFTDIPERGLKCKVTAQTTEEVLALFEEICRAIMKYTNGSVLGGLLDDRPDELRSFKERFKRLKEAFGWCLTTEIWKTALKIEATTDDLLLRKLEPDMKASYSEDKVCFEGSRRDTLSAIEEWSESESSPAMFWLSGSSGLGKTRVANTVAKLFRIENRLAGYFFPPKKGQSSDKVMPTIAYQTAKWHADYRDQILDVLQGEKELDLYTGLGSQFELLMKRPLSKIRDRLPPSHKPLIIVLDALENLQDPESCKRSFVDYLVDIANLVPWLKVFVASNEDIETLHRPQVSVEHFQMDDVLLDLRHDVATYARLCAERRDSLEKWTPGMDVDVRNFLSRISKAFVAPEIQNTELIDNEIKVWDSGETFPALARPVLGRISDDDISAARCILAIMSCVAPVDPPVTTVLFHFLRLVLPDIDQDRFHGIIVSLTPIIYPASENTLQILFPRDILLKFLSDQQQSGLFFVDMESLKYRLAQYCSDTMHTELKSNICGFPSSLLQNDEIYEHNTFSASISERLRICSQYWIGLVARLENAQDMIGAVAEFLRSHAALFWIEVLSLLGKLDVGKDHLSRCMVQFKKDDGILSAAKELHALISCFEPAIKNSTPHLYISALMWLPSDSPIIAGLARSLSVYPKIAFEGLLEPTENAVRIDSRGGIWCTTRSPDGSRIVSGSDDGTLEMCDGWTGQRIGEPIMGHSDCIRDVKFSSDGTKFVSGSSDKTVKIWDAWTGGLIKKLKSNSGVYVVAYSPDGSRVVSGHDDGRIRMWDAHKGALIAESPDGHRYFVSSVAYSPDGRRIVSSSLGNTVRIWDAESGAAVGKPLIGHKGEVTSVAYSPDGSRIISRSYDTVRIWDVCTGTPVGELLKVHNRVSDVGYSQDGKTIMSASRDNTIRFWNATDGAPTGVLRRGESRWDPARGHFVSIPKWWPKPWEKSLSLQSLVYSSNPLYIPYDGWVRTLDRGLLLWVPPEHRACSCHATSESTLTRNPCDERLKKSGWKDIPRWADVVKIMSTDEPGRD